MLKVFVYTRSINCTKNKIKVKFNQNFNKIMQHVKILLITYYETSRQFFLLTRKYDFLFLTAGIHLLTKRCLF